MDTETRRRNSSFLHKVGVHSLVHRHADALEAIGNFAELLQQKECVNLVYTTCTAGVN